MAAATTANALRTAGKRALLRAIRPQRLTQTRTGGIQMTMNVATKSRSDSMAWADNLDLAKLLIRVNLGFLLFWHGLNFANGGFAGTTTNQLQSLAGLGIPFAIGYPIGIVCEILAPIAAILGVYSRLAGLAMAIFMMFAIGLRHIANGHLFQLEANPQGLFDAYMLERQFFFLFSALALFFMGGGRYGLNIGGRWNN